MSISSDFLLLTLLTGHNFKSAYNVVNVQSLLFERSEQYFADEVA